MEIHNDSLIFFFHLIVTNIFLLLSTCIFYKPKLQLIKAKKSSRSTMSGVLSILLKLKHKVGPNLVLGEIFFKKLYYIINMPIILFYSLTHLYL